MTTPEEPLPAPADEARSVENVPRVQTWDRIPDEGRNWRPERGRDRTAGGPVRVLVPFDDSEPARSALRYALEEFPNADVTALLIVDDSAIAYLPSPSNGPYGGVERDRLVDSSTELEGAIEIAESRDVDVRTVGRIGSPVRGILEYLETESVDHVVIGSHCRSGLSRILVGSVAEVVVRHSPVPVTVIRATSNGGD